MFDKEPILQLASEYFGVLHSGDVVSAKVILTHCAKVKVTHLGEDDGFLGAVDVDPGGSSGDTSDGPKGRIDQGNSQGIWVFPQYGAPVST